MILGVIVIGAPILATIGISWLMGLSFVISSVAQLIHAFRFTKLRGWVSRYLLASLSVVAGVITLRNPIAGNSRRGGLSYAATELRRSA